MAACSLAHVNTTTHRKKFCRCTLVSMCFFMPNSLYTDAAAGTVTVPAVQRMAGMSGMAASRASVATQPLSWLTVMPGG